MRIERAEVNKTIVGLSVRGHPERVQQHHLYDLC